MLQMGQLTCVSCLREVMFCNEHGLNFRYSRWYNEALEKANAYPVLGIKEMRIEAGLFMIRKPVFQPCNIFQQQLKYGSGRVILLFIHRSPFPTFENRVIHIGGTVFHKAYRQEGHDIQKAEQQEVCYGSLMLS